MDTEKVNHWLTLGANVGVLVGIVFLAVEIRQNTASNQSAAYQAWVAANMELNSSLIPADAVVAIGKGMDDSKDLTEDTQLPFAMWHFSYYQQIQATNYLYQVGTIDRGLWEVEINRGAIHLQLPGVHQWWDAGGKNQLDPTFVQLIESTEPKGSGWDWGKDTGFVPQSLNTNK